MVARRNIYKGVYLQRGSGIGTVISSIFRALVPWIKRGAGALVKSRPVKRLAKRAGQSALKAAGSFASDVVAGQNAKKSAKVNLKQVQQGLSKALANVGNPPPQAKKKKVIVKPKKAKPVRTLI